jgi:hypothetical protein
MIASPGARIASLTERLEISDCATTKEYVAKNHVPWRKLELIVTVGEQARKSLELQCNLSYGNARERRVTQGKTRQPSHNRLIHRA